MVTHDFTRVHIGSNCCIQEDIASPPYCSLLTVVIDEEV